MTPESYLGYERFDRNGGDRIVKDKPHAYTFPRGLSENELAFGGIWTVRASVRSRASAQGCGCSTGRGTSTSCSPGRARSRCSSTGSRSGLVRVRGDRLYTLVDRPRIGDHLLELRFTPGVAAYAFTFG